MSTPLRAARRPVLAGIVTIGVAFGGFGGWAATAPLSSAAIAPGQVVVVSNRQTVQHLEGGIIDQLLVKNGSVVEAGDVLIELDHTQPRAAVQRLRSQYLAALAERARLLAERDGDVTLGFPEALLRANDPGARSMLAVQRDLFASRRRTREGRVNILARQRAQLRAEIHALRAQIEAEEHQIRLAADEANAVKALLDRGFETKPRHLDLQRQLAALQGTRGEHLAMTARAEQRIAEIDLELINLGNEHLEEVTAELRDLEAEIHDLEEQLSVAKDTLARTRIRAPRSGTVINLAYHTPRGVVEPRQPILEIVPSRDALIIEARIKPTDIDAVQLGMPAEVSLEAYNRRWMPILRGRLIELSADSLVDEQTGAAYYLGHVRVERDQIESLAGVSLIPGMPAEVMIVTGQRTALRYALEPILPSIRRSFRED